MQDESCIEAQGIQSRALTRAANRERGSGVRGRESNGALARSQRGVVLFIALIVMVAMSLAAIALIRSVDTTSQVIGNLAFRQASILPANLALEDAAAGLFQDAAAPKAPRITDPTVDTADQNYYRSYYAKDNATKDDSYGVPKPLQTKTDAKALKRQFTDGAGNNITYVIERACNERAGVAVPPFPDAKFPEFNGPLATGAWCDMMQPKGTGCHEINQQCPVDFQPQPFYRVTVRVDGPQNTVSFLQAMLR